MRERQQELEQEINDLKGYLASLFDRLFRMVEGNPEEVVDRHDYERCINLLKMPFDQAKGFVEKMR